MFNKLKNLLNDISLCKKKQTIHDFDDIRNKYIDEALWFMSDVDKKEFKRNLIKAENQYRSDYHINTKKN